MPAGLPRDAGGEGEVKMKAAMPPCPQHADDYGPDFTHSLVRYVGGDTTKIRAQGHFDELLSDFPELIDQMMSYFEQLAATPAVFDGPPCVGAAYIASRYPNMAQRALETCRGIGSTCNRDFWRLRIARWLSQKYPILRRRANRIICERLDKESNQ